MSKKRSKPGKPGSATRRGLRMLRPARSPGVELATLRGGFFAWLEASGMTAQIDPASIWDDLVTAVDLAVDRVGLTDLHRWTADQIEALADVATDDEGDTLTALPFLLGFLASTQRWNGTPEELEAALTAAETVASPVTQVLAELAGVAVDPDIEDAALRALPVIAHAEALLRFLLPRRPVTGTGALRRADTAAAAALVGADLEGRTPRSMWDVPRLAAVWSAADEAGLLTVTGTHATPSVLAERWVTGDADQGREARRLLVEGYLTQVLTAPSHAPWLPHPLDVLLPALAAASVGPPMPTSVALGGTDCGNPDCPVHGQAPDDGIGGLRALLTLPARGRLDQLADDGIVQVADTISAPTGLRALLARVVTALLEAELQSGAAADLPEPDPALAGQAYRLRVELENAQPPVWREVLVDPNIGLDELHETVQRLFAWDDSHLHGFTAVRNRRTTRFAPANPFGDPMPSGEPAQEESSTRLGQLIEPRKGTLHYLYDFGDGWEHRITVVGSQPAGDVDLPVCTAGAGAPPEEDSGGVWGWAERVHAANDPSHPEHADAQEWLGLADGETLDPTRFDAAEVNERLARLRRSAPRGTARR